MTGDSKKRPRAFRLDPRDSRTDDDYYDHNRTHHNAAAYNHYYCGLIDGAYHHKW